jgi:general secretion pathway protein K
MTTEARSLARSERGVALIVVLVVIAILAALVLDFGYAARVDLTIAGLNRDAMRARILARTGFHLGRALIMRDNNGYDSLDDVWARVDFMVMAPMFLEEGEQIAGAIVDENSKFNLNSLVDVNGRANEIAYAHFQRLLDVLELDATLADTLMDWIDKDNRAQPGGAERNYYRSLGRDVKNAPLDSLRELLLVKDYTPEVLWGDNNHKGLIPYVTIFSNKRININTAPEIILESLDDEIDRSLAEAIIEHRRGEPFESTGDLKKVSGVTAMLFARILSQITVSSDYFSMDMQTSVDKAFCRLEAVVQRKGGNVLPLYWRLQ